MQAQIAASHYEADGYGDGSKFLVNCYQEDNPQDPMRLRKLTETPGSRIIDSGSTLTTGVRGLFHVDGHADGKLLVPDGATMRLLDTATETWSAMTGTLAGTDKMRMAFSESEGGAVANGAFYVSTGSAIATATDADWATLLSDHSETAYLDVTTIGQRAILFFGSRFAFSSTLDFNNTTTINWYTLEYAPDGGRGGFVLGQLLYGCSGNTIEMWRQTGDNNNPFAFVDVIQRGILATGCKALLDNTAFFIGDDCNVYALRGSTPQLINQKDPWVARKIRSVNDPSTIECMTEEIDGHAFLHIRCANFCISYDVSSGNWHKRQSYNSDTWEWTFLRRIGGKFYAANDSTKIVELSRAYKSDDQADADTFGTEIVRQFSAHLPVAEGRPPISCVRLDGAKGVGLNTGQGSSPVVSMCISNDNGNTFGSWREQSVGQQGQYEARTLWNQCGRARPPQTILLFRISDPVTFRATGVFVNQR